MMPASGEEGVHAGRLTWAAWFGIFVFGISMTVTGAILPRLSIGLGQAGTLFSVLALAMLASMLMLGPIIDRFGKKPPLVAGSLMVAAALPIIANAPGYSVLLMAVALLGFGGSALNSGSNTLIADLHTDERRKASALNLLGVFYGFGALFVPLILGTLLDLLGLALILYIPAALTVAVAVLFAALAFPPAKHREGVPLAQTLRFVRNPLVLLFAFLLFFESGIEFTFSGFIPKHLESVAGLAPRAAAYVFAAYWGAVMLARALASRVLLRVPGPAVVIASACGTAAGAVILIVAPNAAAAAAGALLIGFSAASVYPTVLGQAGSAFEAWSGTVFGILFSGGLLGGMSIPWAVGQIAQNAGLRTAWGLPVGAAIAIAMLQFLIARSMRAKG